MNTLEYFNENRRLIKRIIYSLGNVSIPQEDLEQEAYIAISKYLPRYDERKGKNIGTYMWHCIRGHIMRYVEENANCIKISPSVYVQRRAELKGETYKLTKKYNDQYKTLLLSFSNVFEIDSLPTIDTIKFSDENEGEMERFINIYTINRLLANPFKFISERNIDVLKDRYGLDGRVPLTFREIALKYKVSCARAQRIVSNTQEKIKKIIQNRYKNINIGDFFYD